MVVFFLPRLFVVGVALLAFSLISLTEAQGSGAPAGQELLQTTVGRYCLTCHNDRLRTGELSLDGLDLSDVGARAEVWERVVSKLRARTMPPAGRPRPDIGT